MATNRFEGSRVSEGTLAPDAQQIGATAREPVEESRAISRDDVRDGVVDPGSGPGKLNPRSRSRRVISASTLAGYRVRNAAGEDLGIVEEIMADIPTGRIAYAVLSFGGFLGIGSKLFAVPWNALELDSEKQEFILDVDRSKIETAPGFDKDNWPDMADPVFAGSVHQHYGKTPYWEHDVTDSGDYMGDDRQTNRSIEYERTESYRQGGRS